MPDQSSAATEHALLQEITAPLDTLPDDPLALVEADFPTAMRGYDRHAVDDYVEQVSRLVAELQATRSPEAAVRRALERVGDQISGILQRAHETAESITAQSRSEAEDRLEQSRREGAAIIDAADRRMRELDADTDRIWTERQGIVADAQELSDRLREVAREAAERFPGDGERTAAGSAPAADPEVPERLTDLPLDEAELDPDDDGGFVPDPQPLVDDEGFVPDVEAEARTVERDDDDVAEDEPPAEIRPRRLTGEESTRIIPPSSDAAQHRRED